MLQVLAAVMDKKSPSLNDYDGRIVDAPIPELTVHVAARLNKEGKLSRASVLNDRGQNGLRQM